MMTKLTEFISHFSACTSSSHLIGSHAHYTNWVHLHIWQSKKTNKNAYSVVLTQPCSNCQRIVSKPF